MLNSLLNKFSKDISITKYAFLSFLHTLIEALQFGSQRRERRNSLAADILIAPDFTKFKSLTWKK